MKHVEVTALRTETNEQLFAERGSTDCAVTQLAATKLALSVSESEAPRRNEILGIVTHDLRSPLCVIALNAQSIIETSELQLVHDLAHDVRLAAALVHIFERFWQIENVGRRRLGLGLYICEQIVRGTVDALGWRVSSARARRFTSRCPRSQQRDRRLGRPVQRRRCASNATTARRIGAARRGKWTVNVVPSVSFDATSIVPPCAITT